MEHYLDKYIVLDFNVLCVSQIYSIFNSLIYGIPVASNAHQYFNVKAPTLCITHLKHP